MSPINHSVTESKNSPSKKAYWRHIFFTVCHRPTHEDPVIDGLRGVSILLIILFHSFYGVLFILKDYPSILAFLNQIPLMFAFVTGSDKAVDIFFVVSAYLLGSSVFKKIAKSGDFSRSEILRFYAKRLARIYPLFLLGLILYAPINIKQSIKNLPYNLLFIDNFNFACIIPVGWSLSIEMQFYALLPWAGRGLRAMSPVKQLGVLSGIFLMSSTTGVIVCLLYPEIYTTHFYNFHPDFVDPTTMMDRLYYPTHTRFGPIILGLIWALCKVQKDLYDLIRTYLDKKPRMQLLSIIFGLGLMYGMLHFPVYQPQSFYYTHFSPTLNLLLHSTHRNLFCVGLLATIVPIAFCQTPCRAARIIKKILGFSWLRPFSQVVFPIYLFHFPMIALAGLVIFRTTNLKSITGLNITSVLAVFLVASALSLLLGILLHGLIEKPMIIRGYRWAEKLGAKPASNSTPPPHG